MPLDRLLEPYGGIGAIARAEQPSHRFIEDEIRQNQTMATTIPPIFLGVAAFLLNVVLGRLVTTQREQIAAMKAVGYGNAAIGLHYLKFVLVDRPRRHRRRHVPRRRARPPHAHGLRAVRADAPPRLPHDGLDPAARRGRERPRRGRRGRRGAPRRRRARSGGGHASAGASRVPPDARRARRLARLAGTPAA